MKKNLISKIKSNITLKLFIVTAAIFTLFITGTLLFQSLFFGRFYIEQKKVYLQNKLEKFKISYNNVKDEYMTIDLMRSFEENNNSKIAIMSENGKIKFITNSDTRGFDSVRIKIINDLILEWSVNSHKMEDVKNRNLPITVVTDREINGIKNIISVVPDNKKKEVLFAITSLQPVNEASVVIKEFYVYFYIGAIILIVILSFVYTNMVSKPLVKMNNVAKKMAVLDFSQKCPVDTEDEIGNLAGTLNFLSDNLSSALTSLKKANRKLEDDIEKERKLEKIRKDFVNAVSHELKTPINLIGGYAEGLKDGVFDSENKNYYIDIIIDESKKMADLVSDMLNLSRLESGNFKITREKFLLNELIDPILQRFSVIIDNKNIALERTILKNIQVYADWGMIEQVINNFLTNAIRYTPSGGEIIFSTAILDKKVKISIENTGKHIPQEEMDKVWNNFYKIDKSRNRELGGTGLGLSIVKNILTIHGFDYGMENTYRGVKFYFIMDVIEQ